MPTYGGNAFEILSQVRLGLNEYSAGLVQATDTSGKFSNLELMQHINNAQYFLWGILFKAFPEYFLTSASLTFTSSVATLPSDCFKIKDIVDSDGYPIKPISVIQRHIDGSGSSHQYYRYGNTLRIDADSVTDTGTIWYYSRCRELNTGKASGTTTLATTAKAIADYYNSMIIENWTDSTVGTISAYLATRAFTLTGTTLATGEYYGIVSDLPEIMQPLIASRAVLTMKMSPRVPIALTVMDKSNFAEEVSVAMQSFAGTLDGDADIGGLFNDFESII